MRETEGVGFEPTSGTLLKASCFSEFIVLLSLPDREDPLTQKR
jgi:hypothetical protein